MNRLRVIRHHCNSNNNDNNSNNDEDGDNDDDNLFSDEQSTLEAVSQ